LTNRAEAAKLAAVERREGYRTMMGTPAARRVMWERFEVMGIYQAAPVIEPSALAYNEGRRSLALQVMADLLAECPELYDRMVVENRARLAQELAESEREETEE
jgi:hypothetical protein